MLIFNITPKKAVIMAGHIGKCVMGQEGVIDMIWTEKNSKEIITNDLIDKFKEVYEHHDKNGVCYFNITDDCTMEIVRLDFKTETAWVMSYKSPDDDDDGDQYYPDDYSSFDDMFNAMLEETRRN